MKAQVDPASNLKTGDGFEIVKANCLVCHSSTLITQSSMDRARWLEAIRYMQKHHNLWPLGDFEPVILEYLTTNYGPREVSSQRRKNLPYYE